MSAIISPWVLSRSRQADVDRGGLSPTHLDFCDEPFEPLALHFDGVMPFGNLDDEALVVVGRPLPALAVDEDGGPARLNPNGQRA